MIQSFYSQTRPPSSRQAPPWERSPGGGQKGSVRSSNTIRFENFEDRSFHTHTHTHLPVAAVCPGQSSGGPSGVWPRLPSDSRTCGLRHEPDACGEENYGKLLNTTALTYLYPLNCHRLFCFIQVNRGFDYIELQLEQVCMEPPPVVLTSAG